MKTTLTCLIGKGQKKQASKTIDLDFAPVAGMKYHDITWKDTGGREIMNVIINHDGATDLLVALQPDESESVDDLKRIYEAHGWRIV